MPIDPTDLSRPDAPHVGSYWAATAGEEVAGAGPVAGDLDTDVAIIGGGYTGLSTAYYLAREFGVAALVLEANRIGWGCSGRNGGMCTIGVGKEDPGAWVERWGAERAKAVFEQGRAAVRMVRDIIDREGIDGEMTPEGALEIAHKPNRMAGLAARQKRRRETFGQELRLVGRDELAREYLASREAHGALLYPEGFGLHALKYARGLARAAQRHGAVLNGGSPVVDWRRDGPRHLLVTPGGTVRARQVVIATNAYGGDGLHPHLAGRLLPVLSNVIVTRPLADALRRSAGWQTRLNVWDTRRLVFYFRLLPDNRVLFGARGGIADRPAANRRHKLWMQRRFADMFPSLAGVESEYFWRGWVCLARDLNPHVGQAEDGSVHYALGYGGTGIALATYCGWLLASRLGGRPEEAGPLLSRPLPRFPLPALRRIYQRAAYAYYGVQDEWL